MQWYVNDASLQSQYEAAHFEQILRSLLNARSRVFELKQNLRTSRSLLEAFAARGVTIRQILQRCKDKDLRTAVFSWLDRTGPFVEDDRLPEPDDYFECQHAEVTDTGLGEATRRTKAGDSCAAYSFEGGFTNFAVNPLMVDHGLRDDRQGRYAIFNLWSVDQLVDHALASGPAITSWEHLVNGARAKFKHLEIAALHTNEMLAREPFEASVRNRCLVLMRMLDDYMADRRLDGKEGAASRAIVDAHFTGERALFTGESTSNERSFRRELTFIGTDRREVFAPWHGKISHRYFRMHFEWPLRPERQKLAVLYLGPKITKS